MPISPTPPSGANTSSPCGPAIPPYLSGEDGRERPFVVMNTSPAATACIVPSGRRRTKRPEASRASKVPAVSPSPVFTRTGLPIPAARDKPVRANCGEARTAIPLREPRHQRGRERREQAVRRGADAGRGEIGRGMFGAVRVVRAVDADADHNRRALAFDQDAGELVAVDQEVIGPFQQHAAGEARNARGDGVVQRQGSDERQFGKAVRRRRVGEQQARIEIAGLRHPGASAAAAARGLGFCGDPQRRALARARKPQRLLVGRADGVVSDEPRPGCLSRGVELHQNSDLAAAVAALISGAG